MGVWLFDVVVSLVPLLGQQVLEVLGREGDDLLPVAWVFLDHRLGVVLEDVGELIRYHDLLGAVDSLLSHVGHPQLYNLQILFKPWFGIRGRGQIFDPRIRRLVWFLFIGRLQYFEAWMKKCYLGSPKLSFSYKMFRIKYQNSHEADRIKNEVMDRMNRYLETCDGRLINVKDLSKCQQLVFYFVTGNEGHNEGWEQELKNNLLKGFNVLPSFVELGPSY